MSFLATMTIINIILWGGIIITTYYTRNKNKLKSSAAVKKMDNNYHEVLHLSSDKIEAFLMKNKEETVDESLVEAIDYLKKIQKMMSDSNWALNTQLAVFKAANTTGDTLFAVRGTADLYAEETLFHTMNIVRADIKNNEMLEISQNIMREVGSTIGEFKVQFGSIFGKKRLPRLSGKFREYEIQITDDTRIASNNHIRTIAGARMKEEPTPLIDAFANAKANIPEDLQLYANQTIENITSMTKYSEDKPMAKDKTESFSEKYLPIVINAMKSYNSSYDEKKTEELRHTLEVISQASRNLYLSVTENETESSAIEQTVMEQMLIRDGLYNPFDKEGKE